MTTFCINYEPSLEWIWMNIKGDLCLSGCLFPAIASYLTQQNQECSHLWFLAILLGERNWREDEWCGEFDQSDSILFVCQRRENFSSSNSIIVYISHEFYIEFPAAHKYPWCNAQSKFAFSRSPRQFQISNFWSSQSLGIWYSKKFSSRNPKIKLYSFITLSEWKKSDTLSSNSNDFKIYCIGFWNAL